jgi:hypothetical protein
MMQKTSGHEVVKNVFTHSAIVDDDIENRNSIILFHFIQKAIREERWDIIKKDEEGKN